MLYSVAAVKDSWVTTTATALAASWPLGRCVVLAELDPSGGDVAARFGLELPPPLGLVSYAAASRRDQRPVLLLSHCQLLPPALPVLLSPPSSEQAEAAVGTLDEGLLGALAAAPNIDIVADCGRLYPRSPALSAVRSSQVLVLVTRPRPEHLYHLASALPALAGQVSRVAVVLAGRGSMGPAEIAELLEVDVLGVLPEDPAGAALMGGRPVKRWPRLWRRLPLLAAAEPIAGRLAETATSVPRTLPADPAVPLMVKPQGRPAEARP